MTVYNTLVKQHINVGDSSNDGTGDSIRDAFVKTNGNFDLLFDAIGAGAGLTYLALNDTPKEYVPFALAVVDEIGFTMTQLTIVPEGTIGVDFSYETGQLYIYGGTLVLDPEPKLSATLLGDGYRARDFGNPEHDQDLVTRRWLYENFLNRDATTVTEYIVYTTDSAYLSTSTTVEGSTLRHNVSLQLTSKNSPINYPDDVDNLITVFNASGGYDTVNLTQQAWKPSHITRKDYVDTKVSLQGKRTIDPATGQTNAGFGRMTGELELYRDPARAVGADEPLLAATKNYVDYLDRFIVTVSTRALQPTTTLVYDLGTSSLKYRYAYINTATLGNLTVSGTTEFTGPVTFNNTVTYVASTNVVSTDNMFELHAPTGGVGGTWSVDDGKDIGFRIHYYNSGDQNAALVMAHDTRSLEWYETGSEDGNGAFVGTAYGTFKTRNINLTNLLTSVNGSITTLDVGSVLYANHGGATGAGILPGTSSATTDNIVDIGSSGARFRNIYAANFVGTVPNTSLANSSTTITTGAGLSGGGTVNLGGTLTLTNTGVLSLAVSGSGLSVSASTGAITIANTGVTSVVAGTDIAVSAATGAVTISDSSTLQSVSARGNTTNQLIRFTNSTSANDYASGAFTVAGGVGIGDNLYVRNAIYVNGTSIGYGYTGSKGDKGDIGYTGSQGPIGYTGSGSSSVTISNTAPSSPVDGKLWFDTGTSYRLFVWSADSAAWVDASPSGSGSTGYTGSAGSNGATGYTGSQGAIGYTGSAGGAVGTGITALPTGYRRVLQSGGAALTTPISSVAGFGGVVTPLYDVGAILTGVLLPSDVAGVYDTSIVASAGGGPWIGPGDTVNPAANYPIWAGDIAGRGTTVSTLLQFWVDYGTWKIISLSFRYTTVCSGCGGSGGAFQRVATIVRIA